MAFRSSCGFQPADELNAIDRAVLSNDGVKNYLALYVLDNERRRIFRVRFLRGNRARQHSSWFKRGIRVFVELRHIHNPAAAGAR